MYYVITYDFENYVYLKSKNFANIIYIMYILLYRILLPHFLIRKENSISVDSGKFCGVGDFVTLVCDAERDCEIHTFPRQSRGSASKCIS